MSAYDPPSGALLVLWRYLSALFGMLLAAAAGLLLASVLGL